MAHNDKKQKDIAFYRGYFKWLGYFLIIEFLINYKKSLMCEFLRAVLYVF
jgi:hypothetical protein